MYVCIGIAFLLKIVVFIRNAQENGIKSGIYFAVAGDEYTATWGLRVTSHRTVVDAALLAPDAHANRRSWI